MESDSSRLGSQLCYLGSVRFAEPLFCSLYYWANYTYTNMCTVCQQTVERQMIDRERQTSIRDDGGDDDDMQIDTMIDNRQ